MQGFSVALVLEHCLTDLRVLLARLRGAPPDLAVAKALAQQLLQALAACHAAGFVHRDVAPSNILISAPGTAKLADFGQARRLPGAAGAAANGVPAGGHAGAGPDGEGAVDGDDATPPGALTPGSCLCTRWYKAPELLLNGRGYGQGVDMWSAGCILAELLAGRALFPGSSDIAQLALMGDLLGSLSEERWPGEARASLLRPRSTQLRARKQPGRGSACLVPCPPPVQPACPPACTCLCMSSVVASVL